MRCPECGTQVPDNLLLCPQCGTLVEETRPMRAQRPRQDSPAEAPPTPDSETRTHSDARTHWQRIRPILFWTMGVLCVMVLALGGAAYGGLYQGERERQQKRQDLAEQHYQAGLERLEVGEYELAIAEFEYVLDLDPDHPFSGQGIAEAEARMAAVPTPTVETYDVVVDDLYEQAKAHYEGEDWDQAIATLTQVRVLDPAYEAEAVEDMLFTSLYNTGMVLLDADRLEEGIFYLDQAVALRPLDEEALTQRSLAIQYMTALGYWGVDWEHCIKRFEQLYATAPNYKDTFQRLYQAHVAHANAWYTQGEMCPAEEAYAEALRLLNDPQVEQKRVQAEQICLVATPTPIAPITGTMPITLTERPPGFNTGRLAYPAYNTQTGLYDVYALFADGRLMRMAAGADQPSWMGASGALGYRDLLSPGLALLAPGQATPRQLAPGGGLSWPTFSPDGGRMAYAVQDAGGVWQIMIAPTDGSAAATVHAEGQGPLWGPTGLLAWTGCDDGGTCGVFVDQLDDGQPATRLTASINDIGLSWSPNGELLAYMSDVTGNWEVYLLSLSGGVVVLTDDPASDGLPAWAPDGSGLAFVSNRDGVWGLYLMGPNGENPRKALTLGPSLPNWTAQRLSWAP